MSERADLRAEACPMCGRRPNARLRKAQRLGADDRGDGPCADCGTLDNIVWFTDNVFWNAVTGENVVHEESRGAILCVVCFVRRSSDAGFRPTGWRLLPEWPWREFSPAASPSEPKTT